VHAGTEGGVLLTNAVDQTDYQRARKEVKKLGLDPDEIPHRRPE
jgi:hypothetical protein